MTAGWTHEEAKRHTVVERLLERCAAYSQDSMPCPEQGEDLPREDWCERCLAADLLTELQRPARWADLFGIDPDFTGGKPVGEWLEDQRGEA